MRTPLELSAVPEIRGAGHVTRNGSVWTKVTNIGVMGNPFPNLSSDPGGQWPGPSGVEYMYYWSLWVGAIVPGAATPTDRYRVTQAIEWRPPSLDPADRIYASAEGAPGTLRWIDDDGDGRVDEEFQNGKDDDGDGLIDEDLAVLSQGAYNLVMRDDTPQSIFTSESEPHVPLGLEVQQTVQSYETEGADDFVAVTYRIRNVSGHELDSVYVGFLVDQDVGPVAQAGYWSDDLPEPRVPSGFYLRSNPGALPGSGPKATQNDTVGLCTNTNYLNVCGFTMTDDDGDDGRSPGASVFMLLGRSLEGENFGGLYPLGLHTYRLYRPGVPYVQGGAPTVDLERYAALAESSGVVTGHPSLPRPPSSERNDWSTLVSVGPTPVLEAGSTVIVTVAFAVFPIDRNGPLDEAGDPRRPGTKRYQAVREGAARVMQLYLGSLDLAPRGLLGPNTGPAEWRVRAPADRELVIEQCVPWPDPAALIQIEPPPVIIPPGRDGWVDLNCAYCDAVRGRAFRRWIVPWTPARPNLALAPEDHAVRVSWDNHSEVVPDRTDSGTNPNRGEFQPWGYRVYRVAGNSRPVGTIGPSDREWELLANLRHFDALSPLVDSVDVDGDGDFDSTRTTADVLLDTATGARYPAFDVPVLRDSVTGDTLYARGVRTYFDPACQCTHTRTDYRVPQYEVGRYRFVDTKVLNGFRYFYAVTGVDSSGSAGVDGTEGTRLMREGRRYAVENDGVVPQDSRQATAGKHVFVVPNPYRGRAQWDLTPTAADPTGTHVDFFAMPPAPWTLRIYTLSGDLVREIRDGDPTPDGRAQHAGPDDDQASWNLISRNGQDVASGIYLFTVESNEGTQRGKFVIIR